MGGLNPQRDGLSPVETIHVIDATSFETEEKLFLKLGNFVVGGLFFDPSGGALYVQHLGTLYEWDLRKNEPGPEWWIGEEQDVRLEKFTFYYVVSSPLEQVMSIQAKIS